MKVDLSANTITMSNGVGNSIRVEGNEKYVQISESIGAGSNEPNVRLGWDARWSSVVTWYRNRYGQYSGPVPYYGAPYSHMAPRADMDVDQWLRRLDQIFEDPMRNNP